MFWAVCVATEPYADVVAPLYGAGWKDVVPVWDIIEAYPKAGLHNGWLAGRLTKEDRRMIYSFDWSDGISFSHFNSFLEWRMRKDGWMNKITHRDAQ
jgi:hypothetical protein